MSQAFIKKNIKLSLEFDNYMVRHPELFDDIPNGAYIIITISGDDKFNANSVGLLRKIKSKKVVEAHKADDRWSIRPLQQQGRPLPTS